MSKPSHRAYVVTTPKKGGDKGFWREVGVVWPHKSGNGYDVVIHEGVSVHGRIVCTEPKEKEAEFEARIQDQIMEASRTPTVRGRISMEKED